MLVFAIDAGNIESGYAVVCENYKPLEHGKIKNEDLLEKITLWGNRSDLVLVLEMVASYGMSVGKTVFDTCVWIGRFAQMGAFDSIPVHFIYRIEEKMCLCHSATAKDSNIRQALIDRFAETANGKGTKANPDFFYGFSKDAWSAMAVATTFLDKQKGVFQYEK